jgi:hypothetical protein
MILQFVAAYYWIIILCHLILQPLWFLLYNAVSYSVWKVWLLHVAAVILGIDEDQKRYCAYHYHDASSTLLSSPVACSHIDSCSVPKKLFCSLLKHLFCSWSTPKQTLCAALYCTVLIILSHHITHCSSEELSLLSSCTALYCTVLIIISHHITHCSSEELSLLSSCTVLHCTVLHCTVLHCAVMWCTALYCTALCCNVM